jgi:hydrogenase expression/formation protein HypD
VYSTLDALEVARNNPSKKIVFMGVGFETTSPTIASAVLKAQKDEINNFTVLSVAKIISPAMKTLLDGKEVNIDGFICPGHVSAIIGSKPYNFITTQYKVPCVICGFEPLDILQSIYMLVKQIEDGRAEVEIQYERVVKPEGNKIALDKIKEVFKVVNSDWRGIGNIPLSGLEIKDKYGKFSARKFEVEIEETKESRGCRCGEVLRGVITPHECPLFRGVCTPENPQGACMVSTEGTCAAYYKYN